MEFHQRTTTTISHKLSQAGSCIRTLQVRLVMPKISSRITPNLFQTMVTSTQSTSQSPTLLATPSSSTRQSFPLRSKSSQVTTPRHMISLQKWLTATIKVIELRPPRLQESEQNPSHQQRKSTQRQTKSRVLNLLAGSQVSDLCVLQQNKISMCQAAQITSLWVAIPWLVTGVISLTRCVVASQWAQKALSHLYASSWKI